MRFVRSSHRRLAAVSRSVVLAIVYITASPVVVIAAVWLLYGSKATDLRDAQLAAANLAITLERDLGRTLESYDLSLLSTVKGLSIQGLSALSVRVRDAVLFDGTLQASYLGGVFVFDRDGRLKYSSHETIDRALLVSDRDYFRVHKEQRGNGLFIGAPFDSHLKPVKYISISRRVEDSKGEFGGVAAGAIRLDYIQGIFDVFNLGAHASISLFRADGMLIARRPEQPEHVGHIMSGVPVFEYYAKTNVGNFVAPGSIDDIERTYAYRQIGSLPLIIVVGFALDDVYQTWNVVALAFSGALIFVFVTAVDLGLWLRHELRERAQAEDQVHRSASQLQLVLNNSNDLLVQLDWNGVQRFVSPASINLLGIVPFDLVKRSYYELVHKDDEQGLRSAIALAKDNPIVETVLFRMRHKDGSWRNFEAKGRVLSSNDGLILVARDVTDRMKLQVRLNQSQRLEAVGRLTAGVAHDFNNLLQTILGGLDLAMEENVSSSDLKEFLQLAMRAGRRGARLTSHLLSFSRQQALKPEVLNVVPLLDDLGRTLSRTLGHSIHVEVVVPAWLPFAYVDAAYLDMALLNLSLNARDAMAGSGVLKIEAFVSEGRVGIAVSDNGSGMTEDIVARACEPFFTTKGVQGSGLGLSMVQGFVAQSGGEFVIVSEVGTGSVMTLFLPFAKVDVPESSLARSCPSDQQGRVRLVIDDEGGPSMAMSLIEQSAHNMIAAGDVENALALITSGLERPTSWSPISRHPL